MDTSAPEIEIKEYVIINFEDMNILKNNNMRSSQHLHCVTDLVTQGITAEKCFAAFAGHRPKVVA